MKKLLSTILCLTMLSSLPVSAAADPMADALAAVKSRITVPAELTEFDSTKMEYNGETSYDFTWSQKDGVSTMNVDCDQYGRITDYSYWDGNFEDRDDNRLSPYTKEDAQKCAMDFLKKALPDAFGETSDLVLCNDSSGGYFSGNGINYNFHYSRTYDGITVENNYVSVIVTATQDGLNVRSMTSDYNYDTEFIIPDKTIENPEDAYKTAFPINLRYVKDYEKTGESKTDATSLEYYIKDAGGYISAATGEVKEPKEYDVPILYDNAKESMATADAGGGDMRFTEQEQKELDNIAGLKSASEIEKILRSYSDLKITSAMKLKNTYISKYDEEDNYVMHLSFSDDKDRSLYASVDAKTGKIKSLSNHDMKYYLSSTYEKYDMTDAEKADARKKADNFFAVLEPEMSKEYDVTDENNFSSEISFSYSRMANGIEYQDNYATVSYDVKDKMITGYNVYYSDAEFADPSNVVDKDAAYEEVLKNSPLKQVYILTDSDQYELCYTLSDSYLRVDAKTGKIIKAEKEENTGKYTDLDGHWCKEAVERLSDVGIRLNGTEFKPNENITKSDILRLFGAGLTGRYYLFCDDSEIIARMSKIGVIPMPKDEEEDNSPVTREDAFVYMVHLAGFERVAKLSNIYKVDFADADIISPDKIGYAAILSGMGVIAGSNGTVRPNDYITRAEAAQMLYKYLLP